MRVSIALLSYDHGIIRQVIDVLGEALSSKEPSDFSVEAMEITAFLSDFIDRFHHHKEERFVFPLALSKAPELRETIGELVAEHAKARELLEVMRTSVGETGQWTAFSGSASSLIAHMTAHINKEELSVFGKIEDALSPTEDREVRQAMTDFTNGFHTNYYRIAEEFSKCIQDRILGPEYYKIGKEKNEDDS
jgi:hemerythrin-like domain-containing protein